MVEDEEKSPKASPLTLTGVLKTPVKDEGVKRRRKRKIVEKEQPKEKIPVVEAEDENDEMGVFEYYIEQPGLFPTSEEETTTPPVKTENRGK